jgi:bifunctional DNase/RNase
MSLVRLNIKGISYSQTQNGAYALILSEEDGARKLPIVIGAFEAQSIAIALENDIRPPRPLTHDLFKTFADRYGIVVKQVIVHKLVDGVFYSSIIIEKDKDEEILDARTSDAIALALRFKAPIFTYKDILDQAGIHLQTTPVNQSDSDDQNGAIEQLMNQEFDQSDILEDLSKHTLKQLKELLNKAITREDYETAARLRDELSKRNK